MPVAQVRYLGKTSLYHRLILFIRLGDNRGCSGKLDNKMLTLSSYKYQLVRSTL